MKNEENSKGPEIEVEGEESNSINPLSIKKSHESEKKMVSFNFEGSEIKYLDSQAELEGLNRTQFLRKLVQSHKERKEKETLNVIKQMASLNLRKKDSFTDKLNQIPLEIIFKNLNNSKNSADFFVASKYQIRTYLAGEIFDLSIPKNQELFDKINKFVELFQELSQIRYKNNYTKMKIEKKLILSSYNMYLSQVLLNQLQKKND